METGLRVSTRSDKPSSQLEEGHNKWRSRIQKKGADQGFRRKTETQRTTVQDVRKDQYDQLSKDVQMFISDEEVGHTFASWYKRYGPVVKDSVLLGSKKCDLILMDEAAYRKYADDVLPKQPHEIDFETTVANLEKLFASRKTLIRRRHECFRINCPPLTASCVPFRDYANMIKRMDEDARLKELDYTALKTLQFVAGLQDPSLREVRLRMLRRLDTHTEDAPLTVEDLVADCENFTALKMDNTDMEGSHDIHVVQKKNVKCFNCGGPHYRSTCPLLSSSTRQKMRQKPRRRSNRRRKSQCKNVVTFAAENARTYLDVNIRGRSLRSQLEAQISQEATVPYASVPDLDAEIDRLVAEHVIFPVEHSEWATPIVVVKKKNGQIRLCGDFSTGLNDALQLHQHPLPTAENVFTKLNGGQLFTQIDFAEAYLQVEVEEESKEMLTINTHRGLYRYNRLPFGVKSAPGIFQQIMDSMICGLEGVAAYLDDVIVTDRTQQEHRHNLEALFGRIHEYGFRVRLEKCSFLMPQIRYLGCIIDKDGRHSDPEKIEVIRQMPVPKNVAEVRSFLGMINYYGSFVAEMRQLRAPLDALLKKNVPFKWNEECEAAFNRAKEVLASDLLLTHFDPSLDIIVAADASEHGIGAVILHRIPDGTEKAIWHASRSLTAAERNYGQIEKEGERLDIRCSEVPPLHIWTSIQAPHGS
ncbi:hypothetical protein RB195_024918 [Necator americanus]|uniref:Reverse transcriptase domain-containing protein n=1 Tax=Necator americanus TaxID=51031 RepID=A0ABR1EQ42_NECAM